MKKLLQLIFGDLRNTTSVALALVAAYGLSRIAPPGASGALLVLILIGTAAWRAF